MLAIRGVGSYTSVHAAFVPPLAALSKKGGREQEILNPNLNLNAGVPAPYMQDRGGKSRTQWDAVFEIHLELVWRARLLHNMHQPTSPSLSNLHQ